MNFYVLQDGVRMLFVNLLSKPGLWFQKFTTKRAG